MVEGKEYVIDAERQKLIDWKELWAYRELFYFFTWRDIKIKYKQTVFGFLWAVLQPLLMMLIFTLFFGRALNIPSNNLPYPIFVFSGLLLWTMFSSALTSSSNSMVNNALIIKKVYFPRLVIPVSALFVALFDFSITLALFVVMLISYQQPVSLDLIWCWPLSILLTLMATLGPGSLLAALNVKYRDFRYVIPFVVQVLFFLTPVIYPVSFLKYPALQYLIACNPMYAAIELFRHPLTPDVGLNYSFILISLLTCCIFLLTGLIYFKRTEDFFADLA
jgi:lipopolysaccharide transport system permease protein